MWALRRLGASLPSLPGVPPPDELRYLARINTAMWLSHLLSFGVTLVMEAIYANESMLADTSPTLAQQVRLARSAQCVLHVMLQDEGAGGGAQRSAERDESTRSVSAQLRLGLPWLPAYDRRDALAVRSALDHLAPELAADDDATKALAFSAYTASCLHPSPGDLVHGRSLREWLHEKRIHLPPSVESQPSTWMDGTSTPAEQADGRLPLASLAQLGWRWRRGMTGLLQSPRGAFCTHKPSGFEWRVDGMTPLTQLDDLSRVIGLMHLTSRVAPSGLIFCFAVVIAVYASRDEIWHGVMRGVSVLFAFAALNLIIDVIWISISVEARARAMRAAGRQALPHPAQNMHLVQQFGYSWRGLLVGGVLWPMLWHCFFFIIWIQAAANLKPSVAEPLGSFVPPNVPSGPVADAAVVAVVVLLGVNLVTGMCIIDQAIHMWCQDPRHALCPPRDMQEGYLA
jgi:hypothetical protein